MTSKMKLSEIPSHVGEVVVVDAWVLNLRKQGSKLAFLSLFDGTAEIQATLKANKMGIEEFNLIDELYRGASVQVKGKLVEDHRAPGGYELQSSGITIIHPSHEDYDAEVTPDSNIDVMLTKRHIVLRGPKSSSVLRFTSHVLKYLRDFFYKHGLEEVFPPLITEAQAEGGAELFEIQYFDGEAYMTQSSQLYLEAAIYALRDVFCILPSYRAEKSRTKRHLTEYRHVEAEFAWMDFEELLNFIEDMIIYVVERVKEHDQYILDLWEHDLKVPSKPFVRIDYEDAIKLLKKEYDIEITFGEDISDAPERQLVDHFGSPVILQHFPTLMKPFYHKIDPDRPDVTRSADFLFPICGELIGSGERETDIDSMLERMSKMDPPLSSEEYYWYMDLRKYGSVPHSGFGMGLERLIQWLLGLEHIRDATLFPRTVNRVSP